MCVSNTNKGCVYLLGLKINHYLYLFYSSTLTSVESALRILFFWYRFALGM